MTKDIEIKVADGIQSIRLTRIDKKNSLTAEMYLAMAAALQEADRSPAIAATVFVGSGGIFCAGNDINDFMARAKGQSGLSDNVAGFIRYLPLARKPMIAAVDGPAIGVGTTMLFHCDLVYASPTAVLKTPFLDLGLLPEAGSSLLGPMRIGYARAFELLAMGEAMNAEKALAAGLVNAIVPAGELEATAMKAARRLAAKPPEALAIARRLMRGDPAAISERIEAEMREFRARLASPEAVEAFSAFLEKRPPDFAKLRAKS